MWDLEFEFSTAPQMEGPKGKRDATTQDSSRLTGGNAAESSRNIGVCGLKKPFAGTRSGNNAHNNDNTIRNNDTSTDPITSQGQENPYSRIFRNP
jgi:hypothetical protein